MSHKNGSSLAAKEHTSPLHILGDVNIRIFGLLAAAVTVCSVRLDHWLWKNVRTLLLVTTWLCRQRVFDLLYTSWRALRIAPVLIVGVPCGLILSKTLGSVSRTQKSKSRPFLPPLILPSHTTHRRFFPAKHSFTYSYLLVGIPIGWRNTSGFLSCDPASKNHGGWFSVDNEDYLSRGSHPAGLRGKLDEFLLDNAIEPKDFPFAYLVTAPRFFGWSFNPVSFWYLYDSKRQMRAMILEVNNTFDERRMYLLKPENTAEDKTFRDSWAKDFHVSPFNDRQGSYSVIASDPFGDEDWEAPDDIAGVRVDNNIKLSSPPPNIRPKLVARINSTSTPLDPSKMTLVSFIIFMLQWCWTGFLTNPRILWEARILWAKKKLQVFYRPEVNIGSIGRQEQKEEGVIESSFRQWLEKLAEREQVQIDYTSAAGSNRGRAVKLGDNQRQEGDSDNGGKAKIEILSPEWYAELARCHDLHALFKQRCFNAVEGEMLVNANETARCVLRSAIKRESQSQQKPYEAPSSFYACFLEQLRSGCGLTAAFGRAVFRCIGRRPSVESVTATGFRGTVENILTESEIGRYDRATVTIIVADTLTFGYTGLLWECISLMRFGLICVAATYLALLITVESNDGDANIVDHK